MKKLRISASFLAVCLVSAMLRAEAAAPEPRATAETQGLKLTDVTKGKYEGKKRAEQKFNFSLGKRRYTLRYGVYQDPAKPEVAIPSEGYLGMPGPCSCNWYHGGFLFILINGKDIGGTMLKEATVAETRTRAIADFVWDAEPSVVRARFAGLPGDDKLFCEITLEPKQEIKSLRLNLRCYPSFFTAWMKRNGDRKIKTPAAAVYNQGQNVAVPGEENWYAVYYDTIFDVARGEGSGPCAVLFPPDMAKTVKFSVGSYGVGTTLECKPEARKLRLIFWDFRKVPNAEALAAFEKNSQQWLEQLQTFDFAPAAVKTFDPEAELAQLNRLGKPPEVQKRLGKKVDQFRKRIQALTIGPGKGGILQQLELLSFAHQYREFLWELKLAALIADVGKE